MGILLAVTLIVVGLAAVCGRLPDTRDSDYSLGKVLRSGVPRTR